LLGILQLDTIALNAVKLTRATFAYPSPNYLKEPPAGAYFPPTDSRVAVLRTAKFEGVDLALVQHPDRTAPDELKGTSCRFSWVPLS
jgi:hypothetical protein